MRARGHYGSSQISVGNGSGLFDPPTPGECFTHAMGYRTPRDDLFITILAVGGTLAVITIGGIIGIGLQLTGPKTPKPPVTASQKIARVGLVGTLLGTAVYAYFAGKQPAQATTRAPAAPAHH